MVKAVAARPDKAGWVKLRLGGQGKVSSGSMGFGQSGYVMAVAARYVKVRWVKVRLGGLGAVRLDMVGCVSVTVRLGGHGMVRSVTEWCCGAWRVEAVAEW